MGTTSIQHHHSIFIASAKSLGAAADALHNANNKFLEGSIEQASKVLDHSGPLKQSSGRALGGSILATAATSVALVATADSIQHGVAGAVLFSVASAGKAFEGIEAGAQLAVGQMGKFCSGLAKVISGQMGDPKKVDLAIEVVSDPSAKKFSERMFNKADGQFSLSKTASHQAWDSYGVAVTQAASSVTNTARAGVHAGGVLVRIGTSAVNLGATIVIGIAELGIRAAKKGVEFAHSQVDADAARACIAVAGDAAAIAGGALANDREVSPSQLKELQQRLQNIDNKKNDNN